MDNLYANLPKPFFALAPLDDVTDTVFRQVVRSCARPDLVYTEFVNVDALQSAGRKNTLRRLRFDNSEQPLIAQIWGKNPWNFKKTAGELVEMGFSGVDLNMGCPIKHVVQNGCCSALIEQHDKAAAIIDATKEGLEGRIPFSIKTRIGFKQVDFAWIEFLLRQKLDLLTLHLRTVREMSKVPAHWELMSRLREMRDKLAPQTKLVGNGDVLNYEQGLSLAGQHGIDGIMIGRGIFHDPFVFSRDENRQWADYDKSDKIDLYKKHVKLFQKTWHGGDRPIVTLNKFCKIYISGFDGAKELREQLMSCSDPEELLAKLERFKALA